MMWSHPGGARYSAAHFTCKDTSEAVMSKGDRDHRKRLRSTKRCPEAQNGGCSYCITGTCKRAARRKDRQAGKAETRL